MELDKLIKSINNLSEDAKPRWGVMSSSQMLWHCNKFIVFYLNEKRFKPNVLTYVFGSLHLFYLKYILRWNYEIYPKNSRTLKFFDAKRSDNLIFEEEKKKLIESLKKVNDYEHKYLVNTFHGKVDNWTFKEVVRGHTAFHLDQFGVYNKNID
tara:strand:- start:575 stop:1033 length:459 start_codon:yes stop_codon:yes gene_type:complete